MIEYNRVFLDTSPLVYFLERNEQTENYREIMKHFISFGYDNRRKFITSVITVEEFAVYPYRKHDYASLKSFDMLTKKINMEIVDIDKMIAKKAAQIRAEYKGFKAMDALQLATACIQECDLFLTNDKQLRQFKEIECVTIDVTVHRLACSN